MLVVLWPLLAAGVLHQPRALVARADEMSPRLQSEPTARRFLGPEGYVLGPEDERKQKGWRKSWRSGGLPEGEGGTVEGAAEAEGERVSDRGQGNVYLRALGFEPPPFYERT